MQRTDMIDAALVRIAKSKKVIGKTELIKECLEELERFQVYIKYYALKSSNKKFVFLALFFLGGGLNSF